MLLERLVALHEIIDPAEQGSSSLGTSLVDNFLVSLADSARFFHHKVWALPLAVAISFIIEMKPLSLPIWIFGRV